jgi:hypothetical protein
MTVYVYRLRGQIVGPARTVQPLWFSLTADTEEELHPLAEKVGMYRHFYHAPLAEPGQAAVVGHYALDEGERQRAIALGAQRISARKWDRMQRQRARQAQRPGPG